MFCVVAAATVAVQCLLRTTVASLGSEVSARPGVSGQSRPPPHPPIPPKKNSPRQLTLRRPRQPTSPAASTQRTLLGLGCSPPAGGRGPAGRGPAGWSSVSNRLRRPLPPACSHTDAAPASGTQRLNTPAAQTTGGGNKGVQVISETLGEVHTRNKGRGRGTRREKVVKKVRY